MNCLQTERISLLIDGELTTTEAREVQRHLLQCRDCQNVRADFLNLRSQIADYGPLTGPLAPQPELAKILTQPGTTSVQPGVRTRLLGAFAPHFNSPLAAFAALLLLAFTIGAIAFLRSGPPSEIASDNQTQQTQADDSQRLASPSPIDLQDEVAGGRKPSKAQPGVTSPNARKPNSRIKPSRERSAPPPSVPQPRNQAPPTYAGVNERDVTTTVAAASATDTETLTMRHLEQSELLLRGFRNVRMANKGVVADVSYERRRARQLVYQNMMLRREADSAGDVQVSTLLSSLEPILLDIANLRDQPRQEEVLAIKDRVERKSLVALLQINSSALARANE